MAGAQRGRRHLCYGKAQSGGLPHPVLAGEQQVEGSDELEPPQRLERKRDLFMCLALHMEKSPMCVDDPEGKFNKTGIVVCESDKLHKVVVMCCSTETLHAVQQVIVNNHTTLHKCVIYLSRKPCSECTKLLIQGEVSSVYYWPRHPELKGQDIKEDLKEVDRLFLRSSAKISVFLPFMNIINGSELIQKITARTNRYICKECKLEYSCAVKDKELEIIEETCGLLNLQNLEFCRNKMKDALCYYTDLLHCSHGTFEGAEGTKEEEMLHVLQLCFILAARSGDT
ncbi:cytidine and dCMP deaminase domain-containing protein 1-like isoform X2 [Hemicordylus capensis]|uniref:cytidine and dCMP deaminase domain-containing protein 1-like isoform X2 n=1 Tax=Hemicordylus capensis TaxID=884348 RepID=UPI0023036C78|nr:cytidine and dCMP deaminase domain-containing protein 1-like isoform X2 [Hemicordylus capensis]